MKMSLKNLCLRIGKKYGVLEITRLLHGFLLMTYPCHTEVVAEALLRRVKLADTEKDRVGFTNAIKETSGGIIND